MSATRSRSGTIGRTPRRNESPCSVVRRTVRGERLLVSDDEQEPLLHSDDALTYVTNGAASEAGTRRKTRSARAFSVNSDDVTLEDLDTCGTRSSRASCRSEGSAGSEDSVSEGSASEGIFSGPEGDDSDGPRRRFRRDNSKKYFPPAGRILTILTMFDGVVHPPVRLTESLRHHSPRT